jgi:predicted metalloprotease
MKWEGRRQSGNVVDNRGLKTAGGLGAGGIIIAILYALLSGDPSVLNNLAQQTEEPPAVVGDQSGVSDRQKEFVSVVLADTEDVWKDLFTKLGRSYQEPKMVLFTGQVKSACGLASSAVGPFYCPGDKQLYIDLDFFQQLSKDLGASGDFAQAYVIAHEVGHHVQNLLGLMNGSRENEASVAVELQADCLAGVWAKTTETQKQVLESGDLDEALNAAAAVGDDRLQQKSQGYVVPDSFTHGSSAQRAEAFSKGYGRGSLEACAPGITAITGR